MRIEWSARAKTDLRDLHDYIAKDSPYYAKRFVAGIIASAETLSGFPQSGRSVPEADRDDVRELIYRNYRIIYRIERDRVFIVTVLHGSRDLVRHAVPPWDAV